MQMWPKRSLNKAPVAVRVPQVGSATAKSTPQSGNSDGGRFILHGTKDQRRRIVDDPRRKWEPFMATVKAVP